MKNQSNKQVAIGFFLVLGLILFFVGPIGWLILLVVYSKYRKGAFDKYKQDLQNYFSQAKEAEKTGKIPLPTQASPWNSIKSEQPKPELFTPIKPEQQLTGGNLLRIGLFILAFIVFIVWLIIYFR